MLPYIDEPEVLKYPPADYSFIEKAHWDMLYAVKVKYQRQPFVSTFSKCQNLKLYFLVKYFLNTIWHDDYPYILCSLLHENLKRHKMTDMISFFDPGTIGATNCGSSIERSRALAFRFKTAKKGQYFLLPYNHAWVFSTYLLLPILFIA